MVLYDKNHSKKVEAAVVLCILLAILRRFSILERHNIKKFIL